MHSSLRVTALFCGAHLLPCLSHCPGAPFQLASLGTRPDTHAVESSISSTSEDSVDSGLKSREVWVRKDGFLSLSQTCSQKTQEENSQLICKLSRSLAVCNISEELPYFLNKTGLWAEQHCKVACQILTVFENWCWSLIKGGPQPKN